MKPCANEDCANPKRPGRGHRYCQPCSDEAAERSRRSAVARTARWREANPEAYREQRSRQKTVRDRDPELGRRRAREWYWANRERAREASRRWREANADTPRVRKYDLTEEEYFEMLEFQDGGCAICRTPDNGKRRFLDVDHDHDTGRVRGLLCNRCNRLLSNARDDFALLEQAASYLAHTPWDQAMEEANAL